VDLEAPLPPIEGRHISLVAPLLLALVWLLETQLFLCESINRRSNGPPVALDENFLILPVQTFSEDPLQRQALCGLTAEHQNVR